MHVVRAERTHRLGKPRPSAQLLRQVLWTASLQHVDDGDEQGNEHTNAGQDDSGSVARERDRHEDRRHDEEAHGQVRESKPAVLGGRVAKELGGAVIGTLRSGQITYQMTMPLRLKKRCA